MTRSLHSCSGWLAFALALCAWRAAPAQAPIETAPPAGETADALPPPAAEDAAGDLGALLGDELAAGDASADDLDSLLDAADKDLSQLGRVDVSSAQQAPSLAETVTSVSRQASTVGKSPAAVFVVTQEMIQRSGANNIPDLLRLVPGLEVARVHANMWAVSSRGFNGLYAKYMLVQIDGRAVYTQFFSGVMWNMQDVVLQDVERIEVVRGPGASVWGANAVNGVINIITKRASDTQGVLAQAGVGTEERGFSTLRYGGQAGENLHWRVFGKQFERDGGYFFGDDFDDWRQQRGGFRADWTPTPDDLVTVQGEYFDGDAGQQQTFAVPGFPFASTASFDNRDSGGNAIVRWSRVIDDDTDWSLQTYYDSFDRETPLVDLRQETFDIDWQLRFPVGARHNVICGAGYRQIDDHFFGSFSLSLDPEYRNTNLFSAFIQDEITLSEDSWYLIVGAKWLHNDFSGPEYQPTIRLLYTPNERETLWAAVSRAVRTPNRIEDDFTFNQFVGFPPPGFPTYVQLLPNRALESDDLVAYEIGYRAQPVDYFSWDLATFYNNYTDLGAPIFAGAPFFDPTLGAVVVPQMLANVLGADTYGAELASTYEISRDWRLSGAYTLLYMDVHGGSTDLSEGSSPHNQANLRSSWDLRPDLHFDVIGRYVDNLPALGISSYVAMDVRLGWRPWADLEWAIVGRNLLDDRHAEFRDAFSGIVGTEVQSEMYSTLTWTY